MADMLIVDDDPDLASTLSDVLQLHGHTTRIASNGEEGLAAMSDRLPDLLLLDVEMPVLDGPSMAYRILQEDAGREHVPIVLLSGYPDLEVVADRIGTPYRIKKPCSLSSFTALVDRARRERREPNPASWARSGGA